MSILLIGADIRAGLRGLFTDLLEAALYGGPISKREEASVFLTAEAPCEARLPCPEPALPGPKYPVNYSSQTYLALSLWTNPLKTGCQPFKRRQTHFLLRITRNTP
jgi:hypothetical protein